MDAVLTLLDGHDNLGSEFGSHRSAGVSMEYGPHRRLRFKSSANLRSDDRAGRNVRKFWVDGVCRILTKRGISEITLRLYDPDLDDRRDEFVYSVIRQRLEVSGFLTIDLVASSRFGPEQKAWDTARVSLSSALRF